MTVPALLPHVARNTGDYEWYTPLEIVVAARQVLGGIDLDPASCLEANGVVGATRYHDVHDDGLAHEWHGRVWLNPPYALRLVRPFSTKLLGEYRAGRVTAALVLVNASTEAAWFRSLHRRAAMVCFLARRVRFLRAGGGAPGHPLQGQAVLYFGPDVRRFRRTFSRLGTVTVAPRVSVTRCAECDTPFMARRDARTCSPACRQRAYRTRLKDGAP